MQRSIDETQAGTDLLGQSTILPSIMPAMNSIQSNDIASSHPHNQSGQPPQGNQSPEAYDELNQPHLLTTKKSALHNKGMSLGVDQQRKHAQEGKRSAINF